MFQFVGRPEFPRRKFFESKSLTQRIPSKEPVIMNKITIALLGSVALSLCGCGHWWGIPGNGHIVTENRSVSDFSQLQAEGMFEIDWRSGPPSLSITTDQNLLQYIDSTVVENRLKLRSHEDLRPTHRIKVVVSSSTRSAARMTGATRLNVGQLSGSKFALETTGGGQGDTRWECERAARRHDRCQQA